jgi:hypothetical protein
MGRRLTKSSRLVLLLWYRYRARRTARRQRRERRERRRASVQSVERLIAKQVFTQWKRDNGDMYAQENW